VGFKPTPTIAATIATAIATAIAAAIATAIAEPTIPADPAGHHHNRAIRKTEWIYQRECHV